MKRDEPQGRSLLYKESNEKEEGSSAAGGENAESLISEKDYSGYGNYKEVSIK